MSQENRDRPEHKPVKKLGKHDEAVFREWYDLYWDNMFIQAYKVLKDSNLSEDIVQEVFTDLWDKKQFNRIENLPAYLHQSVKYKVLKALRKNRIRQDHLQTSKEIQSKLSSTAPLTSEELKEEILHHMEKLPSKCRKVFYKSRFEHIPNREIAKEMGISIRTVETHISHALKLLRRIRKTMIWLTIWWYWW
ncbi:RNA polymerase sigma-70 factor [Membranihabitans maritimus]|uniref:RNA polymerase sigma-70 factor n=1 Tax=Membranihabitans maritimus TaxID=2904244 RepID=UPI001F0322BF|nr:RNA polymerase sigma-70 factor [Membranihabitans maritimus]